MVTNESFFHLRLHTPSTLNLKEAQMAHFAPRQCKYCGITFTPQRNNNAKYCSPGCGVSFYRKGHALRKTVFALGVELANGDSPPITYDEVLAACIGEPDALLNSLPEAYPTGAFDFLRGKKGGR